MKYQLIKSNRKTIAISFDRDGNLVVKAPLYVGNRDIEDFVRQKSEWIEATALRLKRESEKEAALRPKLCSGDILPYLGDDRILTVICEDRQRSKVVSALGRLILHVPYAADYEERRCVLEQWYRRQAQIVIGEKVREFVALLGVSYAAVRIKDQRSRWGSCSGKGNLNFNWRILMAPEAVCDYVIIHELCHLVHMDHSERFWKLVESVCPDYRRCRAWLKEQGKSLYPI